MEIFDRIIRMSFAEPWDSAKVVNGKILNFIVKDEREYLFIEDEKTTERYLVAARYVEENVTDILNKGKVIVGIYLIEESETSVKEDELFNHLQYEGGGSITLIE